MIADRATLLDELRQTWDPESRHCGRLVRMFIGIWHYSVALSDTRVIFLGPPSIALRGTGYLFTASFFRHYHEPRNVKYLPVDRILENIEHSLTAFHGTQNYCVCQWNCEHWARLVTTGDPVSHQVNRSLFGMALKLGGHFRHPHAAQALAHAGRYTC